MSVLSRRAALRAGVLVGAASPLVAGQSASAYVAQASTPTTVFNVASYGAVGDGITNDTTSIQNALNAAGKVPGSSVYFPPAPGACYRTTGLTVPGGIGQLTGESTMFSAEGPGVVSINGSVLAPMNDSVTRLLTIGVSGSGVDVPTNPHGLTVEGLGFLGTAPNGQSIPGFWAAVVTDTSDVSFNDCRDLFCGAYGYPGYPSGGNGTGGFVSYLSSGTDNAFSVNGRVMFCSSYGAGTFVLADGLSAAYAGGGSTDGRIVSCQVNGHGYGVQLGPANAGAGGWAILETHFSSEPGICHIDYGTAGTPWTLRVESCYLDVCGDVHIHCDGRGLLAVGNYFRGQQNVSAIRFGPSLTVAGRDPAAQLVSNTYDLNGNTAAMDFAKINAFTAKQFAVKGGGEYRANIVHNHGAAMPASWVSQFTGSDGAAIANAATATLELVQGPVLTG